MTKEIHKSYKFRIYPTKEQAEYFDETFRACAYVYNRYLFMRKKSYEATLETVKRPKVAEVKDDGIEVWERDENGKVIYEEVKNPNYNPDAEVLGRFGCSYDLTEFKKTEEGEWLNKYSSNAPLYAIRDLDSAYQNFFRGAKKGQNVGYPLPKTRKHPNMSYTDKIRLVESIKTKNGKTVVKALPKEYILTDNDVVDGKCKYHWIRIPVPRSLNISPVVRTKIHTIPYGHIQSGTISKTPSGQYYVSLTCDKVPCDEKSKGTTAPIGIDLGIEPFAVTSSFDVTEGIEYLKKAEEKLQRQQQILSHKQVGSSNYEKQRIKVAKLHQKVANQRNNFLHNLSRKLVDNYQIIGVKQGLGTKEGGKEDNKASTDASFFEFVRQLQYKADWKDQVVVEIDKKFAANNICSNCGKVVEGDPKDNVFVCPHCGERINARYNAARNIKEEVIRKLEN